MVKEAAIVEPKQQIGSNRQSKATIVKVAKIVEEAIVEPEKIVVFGKGAIVEAAIVKAAPKQASNRQSSKRKQSGNRCQLENHKYG